MTELAQSISEDINAALEKDQLSLPSLPEVALQIRDEAESEFVSANSLAAVIAKDPGLAAQIVRVANSPVFRATRSIDDLNQAISRLGVQYTANLVTGMAMKQMFQATTELVDKKFRQVWGDSIEVAAWASVLTKRYTRLRPDQSTLAGLTHSIGVLPILEWVEENDHLVRDSMTLDKIIEQVHPSLGTMILRHWNFAEDLVAVPEHYLDLGRTVDEVDYTDIVTVSNLARLKHTDHPLMKENWQSASAFQRVGFDITMDDLELDAIQSEVTEVADALRL